MRNSSALKFLLCFVVIFALGACVNVREAAYDMPLDAPEDAHPAPIKFTRVKVDLPLGTDIGVFRTNCLISYFKVNGKILNGISNKLMDDTFTLALEPLGYDVVSALNLDFDEEIDDEILRSEYKISAKIIDADIDACNDKTPSLFEHKFTQYKGQLYLKIQWAVYDNLRKTTVYKTTTEGYTHQKQANADGLDMMLSDAFSMAAHNLGSDQAFHDLIFFGANPPDDWRAEKSKQSQESRPRIFDPMEKVALQNPPLSKDLLPNHIEESRKIAVMVQGGLGHGSGFFITKQGHILTNNHVVGDALRVRIVTEDKKEKLIAEVLRTDKVRDVALLKLEEVPQNMEIVTAPVQVIWPKVGADIYALGTPLRTSMQDTLTKGIVSAHRKDFRIFGTRVDLIQGDVSIHGGNSGGALLDAYGNIIGISVAGLGVGNMNASLNYFIPIGDALDSLGIEVTN